MSGLRIRTIRTSFRGVSLKVSVYADHSRLHSVKTAHDDEVIDLMLDADREELRQYALREITWHEESVVEGEL